MSAFKEDSYYAPCPEDGCLTVDRQFKSGGVDGLGEEYHDWSIYNADMRKGGCGATWSLTSKQGVETNSARNRSTGLLTSSAETGRTFFTFSDQAKENYDRIFRKEKTDG